MIRRTLRTYRAAYSGLPRDLWVLAAAMLVNRSGTMVLPFLTLYLTSKIGLSAEQAGRILGLYGLGSIAGSYLGGWLSDRVGALRVQVVSLLGTGVGFLVLGRLHGHAGIAVAIVALSVVAEVFRPALFTAVATYSAAEVRTRAYALIRLAANLGLTVGPAVGGVLAVRHYGLLFVVDALTCWAAAILLLLMLARLERAPAPSRQSGAPAISPWRDGPFVAFVALMTVLATVFFQLSSTLPLYFREHYGLAENHIGALLALNACTIVLVEMVLVRAIEHLDHMRVAGLGSLLVCTGFALMPLGHGAAWAALSILVWTVGEMLSLPMTNSVAAHRAGSGGSGRYQGAYTLSWSTAFVLAPLIGTTVYERLGPAVLWYGIGVVGIGLWAGFTRLAPALRPAAGQGDRGEPPTEA